MATLSTADTAKTDNPLKLLVLNAATTATPLSGLLRRDQFRFNTIQIINASGATVRLFASITGNPDTASGEWIQIGSNYTGHALTLLTQGIYPYLYVDRDASTAGTVTVWIQSGGSVLI